MKSLSLVLLSCLSFLLNAQTNLNNGLVAYYPLNGNANDSSGNNHHGVTFGSPIYAQDQWGNPNYALYLDGVNDYIQVNPSASMTPDTAFSIAFRFKPAKLYGRTVIVSKATWANVGNTNIEVQYLIGYGNPQDFVTSGLFFGTDHDGSCQSVGGLAGHYSLDSLDVDTSQWKCMVFTFSKGIKRFYENGVLIDSDTLSGFVSNAAVDKCFNGEFKIGAWWVNDPQYYKGLIDELRLYDRALSIEDLSTYCSQVIAPPTDTPTSVALVEQNNFIAFYPNPVTDRLTIEKTSQKPCIAVIYDELGREVSRSICTENKTSIQVSHLSNGIYYLKVFSEELLETKRFIKM